MDYQLAELIDIKQNRVLLESFCASVGIASAIIDLKGEVLIGVRWQPICTDYHRVNAETCRRCIESDTELANELKQGKKFTLYRCKNGMTDAASPIIIEGRHVANAFVGQFLMAPPNPDFFRSQAAEFGFEEAAYMEALAKVPVVPEAKVIPIMEFMVSFAETVATMGLEKLRLKQVENELRKHREHLEEMVETRTAALKQSEAELRKKSLAVEQSPASVVITAPDGTIQYVNRRFCEVTGYTAAEAVGQNPRILKSGRTPPARSSSLRWGLAAQLPYHLPVDRVVDVDFAAVADLLVE